MYKVIFTGLLFLATYSIGQETTISNWQRTHPTVIFIEESDLENFSDSEFSRLGQSVIIYSGEITAQDLESYTSKMKSATSEIEIYDSPDKETIRSVKNWLAANRHVKILKRSYFDQLSDERKAIYLSSDAMILAGEQITIEDILAYQGQD